MEEEPLQRAMNVIEVVTEEICNVLGERARSHVDPNRLFASAESHIENGLSVNDAKKLILASILPQTRRSLEDLSSTDDYSEPEDLKGAQGYSERDLKLPIASSIHSERLESDVGSDAAVRFNRSTPLYGPSTSKGSADETEGLNPIVGAMGPWQLEIKAESLSASPLGSPEISILSPPPKVPAPVIDLSDDSYFSGPPSCNSDIVIVGELESRVGQEQRSEDRNGELVKFGSGAEGNLKTKEEVPSEDDVLSDQSTSAHSNQNDNFVQNSLVREDVISDNGEGVQNSGMIAQGAGMHIVAQGEGMHMVAQGEGMHMVAQGEGMHMVAQGEGMHMVTQGEGMHMVAQGEGMNMVAQGEGMHMVAQGEGMHETNHEVINDNHHSVNDVQNIPEKSVLSPEGSIGLQQKFQVEAVKDNLPPDSFDGNARGPEDAAGENKKDPLNALWTDAYHICRLLPYFLVADVHQTLVDNLYHPDRKAHVMEAYIDLALERGEVVPDNVLLSLNAARKRLQEQSWGKATKRQKVDQAEGSGSAASRNVVVAEVSQPGPSGTNGLGVIHAVAGNGPINVGHPNIDNEAFKTWFQEKMDFISGVLQHVDKDVVSKQLILCMNDQDVEALVARLLEEQIASEATGHPSGIHTNQVVTNQPSASAFQAVDHAGSSQLPVTNEGTNAEVEVGENSNRGNMVESEEPTSAEIEDRIVAQIKRLMEMFSDADPDYLRDRCVGNNGRLEDFQALVLELMENKTYPKMEEYLKRQKRLEIKKKFIEGMTVEDFLEYFEDPEKVFCDTETKLSPAYMENARTQLMRDLPYHFSKDIDNELRKNNYHYIPTLRALKDNKKPNLRKTKRVVPVRESDLDDIFIKELCYARMEVEIKEYLLNKEENKRRAFLWAKSMNELRECKCCYDDEILEEDMDSCNAAETKHKFCRNCVRRFAEEEIGQGRTSFRCLDGECKAEFSLSTLKSVLKPSVFSNILKRKQLEEIAAAGIEDLESCPFCNFVTIMPNQEDKVFKCLNEECMKDSCRLCKEPNHIPLRCEEVEKQNQKDARTFLENKMTEAMVRECWRCKNRFIKADGCNKMRCSCGAMMCYICKKKITGYDHFVDNPEPKDKSKCPLWSNSEKIHAEEVRDAAKKLKDELDPGVELKYDPTKDLPEVPKHLEQRPVAPPPPPHRFHHRHHHPPPAHQRRPQPPPPRRLPQRFPINYGPPHAHRPGPPQAHLPPPPPAPIVPRPPFAHRHNHNQVLQPIPLDPHHQPRPQPQPAHQHNPMNPFHVLLDPGRNDYHHHHHHHYHHHVQQEVGGRLNAEVDRHILRDQLMQFDEILMNVQQGQHRQNPANFHQNPAPFAPHPMQQHLQNMRNLPQEQAPDPFIGEL